MTPERTLELRARLNIKLNTSITNTNWNGDRRSRYRSPRWYLTYLHDKWFNRIKALQLLKMDLSQPVQRAPKPRATKSSSRNSQSTISNASLKISYYDVFWDPPFLEVENELTCSDNVSVIYQPPIKAVYELSTGMFSFLLSLESHTLEMIFWIELIRLI